jgi:hypothetical protein
VRCAAIASVAILALATTGVSIAKTPKQASLSGKISVLKLKTITVDGARTLTCRITSASPDVRLRGFVLGSTARITCKQGVLRTIAHPAQPAAMTTKPELKPSPTPVTPSGSVSVNKPGQTPGTGTGAPAPNPVLSIVGHGNISVLGGAVITIGTSVSCRFDASSPDVSAFKVGDRVDYQCSAGILKKISFSID